MTVAAGGGRTNGACSCFTDARLQLLCSNDKVATKRAGGSITSRQTAAPCASFNSATLALQRCRRFTAAARYFTRSSTPPLLNSERDAGPEARVRRRQANEKCQLNKRGGREAHAPHKRNGTATWYSSLPCFFAAGRVTLRGGGGGSHAPAAAASTARALSSASKLRMRCLT